MIIIKSIWCTNGSEKIFAISGFINMLFSKRNLPLITVSVSIFTKPNHEKDS
jgi:hypothetical protein